MIDKILHSCKYILLLQYHIDSKSVITKEKRTVHRYVIKITFKFLVLQ